MAAVVYVVEYGKHFIYNYLLVDSDGYALGVANGGNAAEPGLAHDKALPGGILWPLG